MLVSSNFLVCPLISPVPCLYASLAFQNFYLVLLVVHIIFFGSKLITEVQFAPCKFELMMHIFQFSILSSSNLIFQVLL